MDRDNTARGRRPERDPDDVEFEPDWPQRPARQRPGGLDPAGRPDREPARDPQSPDDGPSWTSHPTDPHATQVFPAVDRSRFDRGRVQAPGPQQAPRSQPIQPPRQPQSQQFPRQQAVRKSDPAQYDPTLVQGAAVDPYAAPRDGTRTRGTGSTTNYTGYGSYGGYSDYNGYDEETKVYTPVQRPPVAPPSAGARGRGIPSARIRVEDETKWERPGQRKGGYIAPPAQATGRKRGAMWLLWILLGIVVIAIIGAAAFTLAWQEQYQGKIYAGVSALGVNLGGKTTDEATKLLNDKIAGFLRQPVVLTWKGKEFKPSADQIGIKVDVDSTVREAYDVGRGSDTFGSFGQQWSAAQSGYTVPVVVQFSEPVLQTYLQSIAQSEIDQDLVEGDVHLDGGKVVATPGKEGRTLRVYDAIAAVRDLFAKSSTLTAAEPQKVELPVDAHAPVVSADEVQQIESLLQVRVSGPITATTPTTPSKSFSLDQQALIRFTTIERNPDPKATKHVQLGWKDNELKILGDRWTDEARQPAQNARFSWNDGAVSVVSESSNGFETDSPTVIKAIEEHADKADARTFELPGKVITPTVSSKDIGSLGIKELMASGTSTFAGSSKERATNIKVASHLLDGAIIPPGGVFSFLDTMGGIDEAHGFVEGYVIAAERTQKGVGGGVCQVSTTMFRAAFWAGLPILERNQHSYRVSWYEANGEPVGFDAAVFDPGVDLKFKNDTPGYILIQTEVGADYAKISLYGTKSPGVVKLEGPAISNRQPPPPDVYEVDPRLPAGSKKQVETAHAGLNTIITRRIVIPGQPDKVDQFSSAYKPWPNWYIVASPSQIPGNENATPVPSPSAAPTTQAAPAEAPTATIAPEQAPAPAPAPTNTAVPAPQEQPTAAPAGDQGQVQAPQEQPTANP